MRCFFIALATLLFTLLVVADARSLLAQARTESTFSEYALSPTLIPDEVYTVELLIDRVRYKFDETYWNISSERSTARQSPDYKPNFSADHVGPATDELQSLSWLSFQRLAKDKRPIRDITPLKFLPHLTGLVLSNNEITDLSPIASCSELRRLHLDQNPVRDISSLAKCKAIEELYLENCPISDFSSLEELSSLRELSISTDQIGAFKRLKRLPHLRKLRLGSGSFESFEGFPEMPELRVILGARVEKLDGLQQFSKLLNLVGLSGKFDSLEPLRNLHGLTHVHFPATRVQSLQPLAGLSSLRDLYIHTNARELDLSPLESLPSLHELSVECRGKEPNGLSKLRASLSPWDVDFRSEKPRCIPSLELHVVAQKTFDIYDTEKPFNAGGPDENEGLLSSELDWLDDQFEKLLAADFRVEDDYEIPFHWNGARSRTIVLYSDESVAAFPKIVLGIQEILSKAKQDWIIYFQNDGVEPEFIVWIYPDKVVVADEHAEAVRSLIGP